MRRKLASEQINVTETIPGLSAEEAAFLTTLAGDGRTLFTVEDAHAHWGDETRARAHLHKLASKGWIERLERGKYIIIPLEAGPAREWSENPFLIAGELVEPAVVAYWTALHHWQFTEQMPRITYVQTTARKRVRRKTVLGITYQFVTVTERKLFGQKREFVGHRSYRITDPEKTLLDCLDRPDLAGGIHEVMKALRQTDRIRWDVLDDYLAQMGAGAVAKRLGFLVERSDLAVPDREAHLTRWQAQLTSGLAKLDPSSPRDSHRIDTRWRIRVDLDEDLLRGGAV
ncbi:MAG: type IV toxin-antitoxin system AbiEi family antitoxin domain-containing protein [Gemmatimonadota bacterium]